jgi:RNA polymerase sigma-70 factor, ECF subfamily
VTDQDLVELARSGDAVAFEALVGRHHRAALRAAMAALGSADEADDVTQEAWITAHARLHDFRGEASFRTWLLTIVWNKALDRRRQMGRWLQRMVSLDARWESDASDHAREQPTGALAAALSERRPSPELALLGGDLARRTLRMVRALPARLRDPLLLIGSGEYSYEEVAAMLHAPVGTVKWRVSEARRLLRAKLTRSGYE